MRINVVMQGGGMKGIGLVGALARMEEQNLECAGLAGTSAGALVAALYAAGYSARELEHLFMTMAFENLLDPPLRGLRTVNLLWCYGIYKGHKFYEWVYRLLKAKNIETFKDLEQLRPDIDLRIIASDITNKELIVFNRKDYPLVKVAEAVRMSAGIPFFFQAYKWGERLMVDGGLLSNYPVMMFAGSEYPTVGLKLNSKRGNVVPASPQSFAHFLTSLVGTMLEAHDREDEKVLGSERTIHIPTGSIATTQFDLKDEEKQSLYRGGFLAASEYIAQSDMFRNDNIPAARVCAANIKSALATSAYESVDRLIKLSGESNETDFQMSELRRSVSVCPPDADIENHEEGINVSNRAQDSITRVIVADNPNDFAKLEYKAWIQIDGKEVEARVEPVFSPNDGRIYKVRIGFRGSVIQPGGNLKLRYKLRWPGAVTRNSDYWVFPVVNYSHPVGTLKIKIWFNVVPTDHRLLQVAENVGNVLLPVPIQMEGPRFENTEKPSGKVMYYADITSPKGVYVVAWSIL